RKRQFFDDPLHYLWPLNDRSFGRSNLARTSCLPYYRPRLSLYSLDDDVCIPAFLFSNRYVRRIKPGIVPTIVTPGSPAPIGMSVNRTAFVIYNGNVSE